VRSICKLAGVSVIGSHGLRGTHGSLAIEAGETGKAVAAALGHTNTAITFGHYIKPAAAAAARIRRIEGVVATPDLVQPTRKLVTRGPKLPQGTS
jgi:integrase